MTGGKRKPTRAKVPKAGSSGNKLADELRAMLIARFPDIKVTAQKSERWNRMCLTFRWPGFGELLPEERYHRLVTCIPESFRTERLAGFVWLELGPEESIDDFLRLPRSEDVAPRQATVFGILQRKRFFDGLRKALEPNPRRKCLGDFSLTQKTLEGKKTTPAQVRDAKLIFIGHGAFCDCQVIETVEAILRKQYARPR